jgi:peptide/nickel transport system substrate-binding protein
LIENVSPGSTVTLRRDPNYWAADLPQKRGFDNFEEIRIEYIRDSNALFQAFQRGLFDLNVETDPVRWSTVYTFPAAAEGNVVLDTFETGVPKGMNGFVFNTRRPIFADIRVREALGYFLDFEWLNQNLFDAKYQRTGSFFQGSELSALGVPADVRERELLAPFADAVREDILEGTYAPPVSDGSGRDRQNLQRGVELLAEAGYEIRDGAMVNSETGEPLAFEILVLDPNQERVALAFQSTLGVAGITASVRQIENAQYYERILNTRDFDMIIWNYSASLSPGNEQIGRWSNDQPGTLNFAGVKTPAVDAMIEAMLAARDREEFVSAVRAFDRVLTSGFYTIPLFHATGQWIARWRRVEPPEYTALYGAQPATWWFNDAAN